MSTDDLNRELAAALGLPKFTTRAVLTLEVGELPRLEIECYARNEQGQPEITPDGESLRSVRFVVRLEPFKS